MRQCLHRVRRADCRVGCGLRLSAAWRFPVRSALWLPRSLLLPWAKSGFKDGWPLAVFGSLDYIISQWPDGGLLRSVSAGYRRARLSASPACCCCLAINGADWPKLGRRGPFLTQINELPRPFTAGKPPEIKIWSGMSSAVRLQACRPGHCERETGKRRR